MTTGSYWTAYKVFPRLFRVDSDFSGWISSCTDSECKLPGQRANGSHNFPQTTLNATGKKWVEDIKYFESSKTQNLFVKG